LFQKLQRRTEELAVTTWPTTLTPQLRVSCAGLPSATIGFGYPADEAKREHNMGRWRT
jgi:hypothetical protein